MIKGLQKEIFTWLAFLSRTFPSNQFDGSYSAPITNLKTYMHMDKKLEMARAYLRHYGSDKNT
jgi:hypothetical protein